MAMNNYTPQNNGNSLTRGNTVSFSTPQEMDGADFFSYLKSGLASKINFMWTREVTIINPRAQ